MPNPLARMNGTDIAILVGIYGTFALDVFSTFNSSPQTTELFAGDRQDSLMHWVYVGDAVAVGAGIVASLVSQSPWPAIATILVVVGMHFSYTHAVRRGIDKTPPTNGNY